MHKQFILTFAVTSHLLSHSSDDVLLCFSGVGEIALSTGELFLHLANILIADVLDGRHLREVYALSKTGVNTSLKHARETRNGNAIFLIDFLHLLISELAEHVFTRLRVRI